jgi:serine/threonine protein kinase
VTTTLTASGSPSSDRIGRYQILHKLASGGMGEVYLARSVGAAGFQKHVVIKKLLPHLVQQAQFVEGLIREAKLLVTLDHPNIVQVLDLGIDGADYFMAMEYVHGYNLATIIHYCAQSHLLIPMGACAVAALHVLAGLEYAHGLNSPTAGQQNVIHRDVSPQNVLISTEGRIKLTDFGIAKVVNEAEGEFTQSLKGKFRYMAPEVVEGGRIDQRYDLFAVGILLFEALCRRHLFSGSNDINILSQVRKAHVPPIARYHPGVKPELVQVAERSLAKEPADRYQTAGDFGRALREALAPLGESEALAQLRTFVTDLYGRPDFPINKPKLPDLNAVFAPGETRSVQLRPLTLDGAASGRRSKSATLAIILSVILVLAVGAVVAYGYFHRQQDPGRPSVIIVRPSDQRASAPRPDARATIGTLPPDAGKVKRPPIKPAGPFTQEKGATAFRKQGSKLTGCFYEHTRPEEKAVTLKVVSTIGANGSVKEVKLEPTTLGGTPLGRCILQVAARIRYPRHDKPTITFLQPVTLKRTE